MAHINKEYAGWPDILIVAGGLELKHRSYGVKTAKLRKGLQKNVCETLSEKIDIVCINEESNRVQMDFLKKMYKMIKGVDL